MENFSTQCFLSYAEKDIHTISVNEDEIQRKCSNYLQFLANRYFDFAQNGKSCRNAAIDILNEINKPWLDEITIFGNSNYKIISSVVAEKRPHHAELSPDKKLLVFIFLNGFKRTAEVFKLPGLTPLFKVELRLAQKYKYYNTSINFSPDSSYFISNSVSSCISIFEKKEVPFISHDSPSFQSCSFSSCGLKLATLKKSY